MDQIGAMLGQLIVAGVLYFRGGYQISFAILLAPALLALSVLVVARLFYPHPRAFEIDSVKLESKVFPRVFWNLAAVALIAAEYVDFPLIAYHFKRYPSFQMIVFRYSMPLRWELMHSQHFYLDVYLTV